MKGFQEGRFPGLERQSWRRYEENFSYHHWITIVSSTVVFRNGTSGQECHVLERAAVKQKSAERRIPNTLLSGVPANRTADTRNALTDRRLRNAATPGEIAGSVAVSAGAGFPRR